MRGPRTHARTRRRAGFSMIELMVVLAIFGLIAGVVVVSGRAMVPGSRLAEAVHTLASRVYGARSSAISRSHSYDIVYDLDGGRYHLLTPFNSEGKLALTDEERTIIHRERLPRGIEFTRVTVAGEDYAQGQVRVHFDPKGTVSEHSVLLTQGEYQNQYTVEVLPLTGLVRFHDGEYRREPADEGDFR